MSHFNLRDDEYFPTFSDLPTEGELDVRYYEDPYETGRRVIYPTKHWCLLVEIVKIIPYLRPMWTVKDKSGRTFPLIFYLDAGKELPKSFWKHTKPGNMISVMYAEQHYFVDGQCGLRVEDVSTVKTYPSDLQTFFGLGDHGGETVASNKCQSCDSDASLKSCAACHTFKYCNEKCQRQHWLGRHKRECRALGQIKDWKRRNWGAFNEYWDYFA